MKRGACSVAKENIAWEVNAYALCADSTEGDTQRPAGWRGKAVTNMRKEKLWGGGVSEWSWRVDEGTWE